MQTRRTRTPAPGATPCRPSTIGGVHPTLAGARLDGTELARIRADFPILATELNGHPLAYLDSAATSQRPRQVLEAERAFLERENAAVHRGAHTLAALATERFEEARVRVAGFIGGRPEELVWTSGATAGLNLLAYAIGNAAPGSPLALAPGDEILVTESEHHANLLPWQQLALRTGARLRWVPVDDDGELILDALADLVGERTRLVAVAQVSNVIGSVIDVPRIVAAAHAVGAIVVLDACQSVPNLPVDVAALGVDAAVFSGHKMLGPNGVGALWARFELLDALPPFLTGGSIITTVTMEGSEFLPPPQRFEAGTQPISQAIALVAAIDYLDAIGMPRVAEHEASLGAELAERLRELPGVRVLGSAEGRHRTGIASFAVAGIHPHDLGQFLDDRGIAVRVGHHCAQPLHRRLGLTATTRASVGVFTSPDEVDRLIAGVAEGIRFFDAAGTR